MTDYIIKLSTEQSSGLIIYVNSPDPPSSPTLEVEDFWRIRLKYIKITNEVYLMFKIIIMALLIFIGMVGYDNITDKAQPTTPVQQEQQKVSKHEKSA